MQPIRILRPYFIGICGGSASGKSSIARAISAEVGGVVPIICLDWYYKDLEDKTLGPTHNWDHPNSFDWDHLIDNLIKWKRGEQVYAPRHDYSKYQKIENYERIDAAPVMILEGILAFENPQIREMLDLMIYVKCDPDTALKRRIIRDVHERGYDVNEILTRYTEHVKPAFETYIAPAERIADFTVYNNGDSGINSGDKIIHRGTHMIAEFVKFKLETL